MKKVGTLAELRVNGPLQATVANTQLLVFLVDDEVVATQARCPHAHGPLKDGEICDGALICPWHGWTYDLKTGECEEDPELSLERYAVHVHGDDIFVSV